MADGSFHLVYEDRPPLSNRRGPLQSVLVLSPCSDSNEAVRAHAAGASGYFCRPADETRLAELLGAIVRHWREGGVARRAPWPGAVEISRVNIAA
jgi:DNA-binding NarL/FixJ family response regulator